MKVVLNKDVKGLGKKLQVVEVSEGYARNYLLPRKIASLATNQNLSEAKTKQQSEDFKKQTKKEEAEKVKELLEKQILEFKVKLGDNGRIFGSVTAKEVADAIKQKIGFEIEKKKVEIETIKATGMYTAKVKLYEGVVANQKVKIIGK